jgi:hypothetical protein
MRAHHPAVIHEFPKVFGGYLQNGQSLPITNAPEKRPQDTQVICEPLCVELNRTVHGGLELFGREAKSSDAIPVVTMGFVGWGVVDPAR